MSLDRFRELLGADPIPFWSSSLRLCGYDWQQTHNCRDDWLRYTWQKPGNLNHEDLELAIQQAETEIERTLGHPVGPEWVCERHSFVTHQGNRAPTIKINLPWATAFGQRNTQHIATVSRVDPQPETVKIQPHWAVHHSEYQMTWETPEHRLWAISLNGTEYDVNAEGITHKADLQRWLNTLGLGTFYVTIDEPITTFSDTDYDGSPIPTIEAPSTVTIDYIVTYSHAEKNRKRIAWLDRWDGHVIDGTFYDTATFGFTTQDEIKAWADGLGLGVWEVYNNYGGDLTTEPPILLIPDKPAEFEVYGCLDITGATVAYSDKMVINGTYYDNTSISGDTVAIIAFLAGLGLTAALSPTQPGVILIDNPGLVVMYRVIAADYSPIELFGLITDDVVSAAAVRPFTYVLEDADTDGYFENAVIIGNSLLPQLECELQLYAIGRRLNGHPDKLCRIRPIEIKTFDPATGDFEINLPTHLLIKNELLDQRVAPYNDPFPIDLCCSEDDLACDPESFYLEQFEIWRIWHDETLPDVYFRGQNACSITEPCRTEDSTGCINLKATTTQWVYPYGSAYHTVNLPDGISSSPERDSWRSAGCPHTCQADIFYYFDPCDKTCHSVECRGDICHKFERAVFMLASARLWDLCPCGCDDNRLRTFQREAGQNFQTGSYEAQNVIVSAGRIGDTAEYPYGTRYGEVEAWRVIRNYLRFEVGAVWGGSY